jgi:hypothetical protein
MHPMQRLGVQAIGQPRGIGRRRPSARQRCTACTGGRATANCPLTRPGDVPHNTESLNPVQTRAAEPMGGMRPSHEAMPENRLLRLLAAYPIVLVALTIAELVIPRPEWPAGDLRDPRAARVRGRPAPHAGRVDPERPDPAPCAGSPGRGRRRAFGREWVSIKRPVRPFGVEGRQHRDGHQQAGRPPPIYGVAGYRSTEHSEIVFPCRPPPHSRMTSPARATTLPCPSTSSGRTAGRSWKP